LEKPADQLGKAIVEAEYQQSDQDQSKQNNSGVADRFLFVWPKNFGQLYLDLSKIIGHSLAEPGTVGVRRTPIGHG